MDTLIEILVLLPELDSLQISSLSLSNPRNLSTDENREMFSLLTVKIKLQKFILRK